ncbi:MAG: SUMF1/EgtB/PvdO family nonheme iron enzyme [Ardenticatenales bacterium]
MSHDASASPNLRVLYLMVDPSADASRNRGNESREIEGHLHENLAAERVVFEQHHGVRWDDVSLHLLAFKPHIVHLACATDGDGELLMERAATGAVPVPRSLVTQLITLLKDEIWCVFASGDRTSLLAEQLAQHVEWAIGFHGVVPHELRVAMAAGFYRCIAFDKDAFLSFRLGEINVAAIDEASRHLPRIFRRGGQLQSAAPASATVPGRAGDASEGVPTAAEGATLGRLSPPDYQPPDAPVDDLIAEYLLQVKTEAYDVYRRQFVALSGEATTVRRPDALSDERDVVPADDTHGSDARLGALLGAMPGEHALAEDGPRTAVSDVAERLASLAGKRTALLGQPGSGKTWTLHQAFMTLADRWLQAAPSDRSGLPVPVLVPLREFGGVRDHLPLSFRAFVASRMGQLGDHFDALVASGRLMLMCDALNEMPRRALGAVDGSDAPAGADLVDDVRVLLRQVPSFVVSCRKDDYRNDLHELGSTRHPLAQLTLAPLDPPRIQAFIERRFAYDPQQAAALWAQLDGSDDLLAYWSACVAAGTPDAFWDRAAEAPRGVRQWGDARRRAWERMIRGERALIPLCREPYMLSVVCDLAAEGGELPGNRVQLFDAFIQRSLARERTLAEQRGEPWPADVADDLRAVLVALAKALQAADRTVVAAGSIVATIGAEGTRWCVDTATAAGLLVRSGEDVGFAHQLLQEYYAALDMRTAMEDYKDAAEFFRAGEGWWDPGSWRVTTVILGELLGGRATGPNKVARWLAPVSPEVALDVIAKNGEGLTIEADEDDPTHKSDLEDATRAALIASARAKLDEPHPHGRAAAYRVLGRLNADDRPGIGLNAAGLPDIVWCAVPGGTVVIEGGIGERTVAPFKIAQFPVTYAQYKAFLDTPGGYDDERWWTMAPKLAARQAEPGEQRWPIGNHPAEGISWYDAMAFCRWLTARMREGLSPGFEIRLPTEAEWQQAATGGNTFNRYPWGKDFESGRANIDEHLNKEGPFRVGQTTAVGMYPHGAVKGLGHLPLHDMSGNIWEWTLSEYEGGNNRDVTNDRPRVVRGGSWFDPHGPWS